MGQLGECKTQLSERQRTWEEGALGVGEEKQGSHLYSRCLP